jgi:catechol 2,3-dioxygenase-like lactoylglutathione lyase family enzyme
MPLGDPKGGDFRYTTEGSPENITAVTIPVSDIGGAVSFYCGTLMMEKVSASDREAILRFGGSFVLLKKSQTVGVDTGVYIGVTDPFVFHRRMVDEGVVFVRHPERGPMGVYASFRDRDNNVVHAIETVPSGYGR